MGKQHQGDITEISIEVVIEGVQRLKLDTSDGKEDLNNYHIKYGPRIIYVLLTLVFNSILVHGDNPDQTMVPIQKDNS